MDADKRQEGVQGAPGSAVGRRACTEQAHELRLRRRRRRSQVAWPATNFGQMAEEEDCTVGEEPRASLASAAAGGSAGAQGIIVITYTPAAAAATGRVIHLRGHVRLHGHVRFRM